MFFVKILWILNNDKTSCLWFNICCRTTAMMNIQNMIIHESEWIVTPATPPTDWILSSLLQIGFCHTYPPPFMIITFRLKTSNYDKPTKAVKSFKQFTFFRHDHFFPTKVLILLTNFLFTEKLILNFTIKHVCYTNNAVKSINSWMFKLLTL